MGIQDMAVLFDHLDVAQKGFVTVEQLIPLLESVYLTPVTYSHVEAAIGQVCGLGHSGRLTRTAFLEVLEEIARRHELEEQAYWDFQALDYSGSHQIKLSDTLTLFQEYHADAFSLTTWHAFVQSRHTPSADVCFDEIRDWLCGPPDGQPATDREVKDELSQLDQQRWDHFHTDYQALKALTGEDDDDGQQWEDTKRHADRKLRKWNQLGVEAMLQDDGLDIEDDKAATTTRKRRRGHTAVSVSDLLDAMDEKYSLLVEALVATMASFAANMDSEKPELTQQIRRAVTRLMRDGHLDSGGGGGVDSELDNVPGSSAMLPWTLQGMMGRLPPHHLQQQRKRESLCQQLMADGKSPAEVDHILKKEHDASVDGPRDCGQALKDLAERRASEKEWLMDVGRGQGEGTTAPWLELCRLQRQVVLMTELQSIVPGAMAVGLAERPQHYQHQRYDPDRDISERLAKERLQLREGHARNRTSNQLPDISAIQASGVVNIRTKIVEEAEMRYHQEREALIFMLQGPESGQKKASGLKMSGEDRHRRLTMLRSHYLNWKMGGSGDSAQNFAILEEAVGLHWADRQGELERHQHNVSDTAVNASVLANLQIKQEVDFATCLSAMEGKKSEGLISALKQESTARVQEHLSNVAFVVLGVGEVSVEDQEFLAALADKYRAVRDKVLVFALKDQHGHANWNSLGREGRQRELQKLRREEKKLRGDGRLADMASIIGPKSQALPALVHLMGESKVYGKEHGRNQATTPPASAAKPLNLLADLVPRYDQEQETLLSWLHSGDDDAEHREAPEQQRRELARMELERFAVGMEGDYEAGLLALGLLERIQAVSLGRSEADREKQRRLAEKRVSGRKWRVQQGDPYKVPADDKAPPKPGDRLSWHCAVLRAVMRRQGVEVERLLRVLQEAGFTDLVEAAAMMGVQQRSQRQQQLATKHHSLDLSTADGREEQLSVLEEAAALRVVGVQAAARKKNGRALSEDEVSAALLLELQTLHDAEIYDWLYNDGLRVTEESTLQQKLDRERKDKEQERVNNVVTVFTRVEDDSEVTDAFVKVLEEKYLALREALLVSAVALSSGDSQSQKQKDKQLQALKKKVVPLWDAGDAEQIGVVLGSGLSIERPLSWLLGVTRSKAATHTDSEDGGAGVQEAVTHLMRRFVQEKEQLLASLSGASGQFLSENEKLALKSRLKREGIVTAGEEGIMFAALACGLAERQLENTKSPQLEADRERYSLLGAHEFTVRQFGREGQRKKDTLTVERKGSKELMQDAVLDLLRKKHVEERQLLAEMVVNPRFAHIQSQAALESSQQRDDRLAALRAKYQASSLDSSSDNLALVQEGLVVLRESLRGQQGLGQGPEDDFHLNCHLMATLLLMQNSEAEQYLADFASQEPSDLTESQEQVVDELRKNHCTNIAALLFSSHALQQDDKKKTEPLIDALNGKYDALRDKLLIQSLINEMGENNWRLLSEREQQQRLLQLKLKERQLRQEGRLDEIAALLGDALNNEAALKKLIGESREEQERRLRERLEKRKRRLADGLSEEECDRLDREEEQQEEQEARQRRHNILEDLQHNYDQEKEALLRQLQEGQNDSERERQKALLQLKLEQKRLRRDTDIDTTALLLQQHEQVGRDREAERRRQEKLARERLEAARQGRRSGGQDKQQLEVIAASIQCESDRSKLQDMAMTALDLTHSTERQLLMDLLEESKSGEQRASARGMSTEDLEAAVQEMGDVYHQWRNSSRGLQEREALQLLKEGVCYAVELRRRQLDGERRQSDDSEVETSLLADLQQRQQAESDATVTSVIDMDEDSLRQLTQSIVKRKEESCPNNIAQVILQKQQQPAGPATQGGAGDREQKEEDEDEEEKGLTEEEKEERKVVKALEMKYDAMRDKVIIEALMREHGEAEWKRLSELERQRKIAQLKRRERQLRHEGKMDEIEALLGQHLKHKENLDSVLGSSQQDQKRSLEERLARRRQLKAVREAQGLTTDDSTLDTLQQQEEQEEEQRLSQQRQSVLGRLQTDFEAEKAALLADLRQMTSSGQQERERQNALVKLRREARQVQEENKLDTAVIIFNMGKQQHEDRQNSLLKERERQRQLAMERLNRRRQQGRNTPSGEDNPQPGTHDSPQGSLAQGEEGLKEAALLAVDNHHRTEQDTLQTLLARCRQDKDSAKQVSKLSDQELRLKLTKLEREHGEWKKESAKLALGLQDQQQQQQQQQQMGNKRRDKLAKKADQHRAAQMDLLKQALQYKLELERRGLSEQRGDMKDGEAWEELSVAAMISLQTRQQALVNSTQPAILSMTTEELEQAQKAQRVASGQGWFHSLSSLAFTVEDVAGEGQALADQRAAQAKLQEEYVREKQAILDKAQKEGVDADAMLKDLEEQFAAKRKSLDADMERQHAEVVQRLEARQQSQADTQATALTLLREAESQQQQAQQKVSTQQGNHTSLLQERVKQRSEARKQTGQLGRRKTMPPAPDNVQRSDTSSSINSMGLRREKTVIEAAESEEQRQARYEQILKEQRFDQLNKFKQQAKQQEDVKKRLEERKGKRETAMAQLLSLGERQKTNLEQARKGEQERQIAQLRKRVERVKHKRTNRSSSPMTGDRAITEGAEEEGDEAMASRATQLQERGGQ